MSEFEIDFEWPMAAKYEFRPASAEEVRETEKWEIYPVASWRSQGMTETELPLVLGRIIPSGKVQDRRPVAKAMELAVKVLVEYKKTPFHEVALKVARAIGLLTARVTGAREGENLVGWHELAQRLKWMFEGKYYDHGTEYTWPHPLVQYKGELGIHLVPDKNNKPLLALRPANLEDALVLYAARMIATGTTFNICEHCKTPFLSGGTRFRNKRGDARFCSSACRWKWHNESRRRAR